MRLSEAAREKLFICIFLSLLVLIAYWGIQENHFISFDDPLYVTENLWVQRGLTPETVAWAFKTTHAGNWHPLTWLSLMLDRDLFGMNAGGYHGTSVILHLLSGLILFFTLNRMTASPLSGGVVVGLFLIHPLHVESVAWVSERKDVLSGLFWMTGLWFYVRYAEQPSVTRYLWVVLSFLCGLLSKPMVVTFPFVLLLLDRWPLGRLVAGKASWTRLVWEKIPLFILSAVASVITFVAQKGYDAVAPISLVPLGDRLANATTSYVAYLGKMFWPAELAILYPYHSPYSFGYVMMALALLIMMTVISVLLHERRPYLLVGWLWYLGTLVPVIGFVTIGSIAIADRYTYLPLIGIYIMIAWGLKDLLDGGRVRRVICGFFLAAVFSAMVLMTQNQVGYWRDTITLFSHTLRVTEKNFIAHELLAHDLVRVGDQMGAEKHYREAIRIKPSFKNASNGLGYLKMIQGKQDEASALFEKTLQIDPKFVPAIKNLGDVRMRQGRLDEAIPLYRKALSFHNEDPELFNNYGVALFFNGEKEESIRNIRAALNLKPDYAEARDNLRKILADVQAEKSEKVRMMKP